MAQEVVGFTPSQREFILNVFGNRCGFHKKQNGRWVRCKAKHKLQVHHIIPRGWYRHNTNIKFPVNGLGNGIPLCVTHHELVHPDIVVARTLYRAGDKQAFTNTMKARRELCDDGIPYWDTTWDMQFYRLNKRFVGRYLSANPEATYPRNGNRKSNGRCYERKRKKKRQKRQKRQKAKV